MILNKAKPKTTPSTPKSSFATAPGKPMAGKVLSAPGNAANKVILAANKASGGTTTSTYRDKYTDKEGGPGASALTAAAMTQAAGFAKIFDKVANKEAAKSISAGKPAPQRSTYVMEHPDPTKQIIINGTTVTEVKKELPVKKQIIEPAHPDQSKESGAFIPTIQAEQPQRIIDTSSTDNTIAPMRAGIAGAADINTLTSIEKGLWDRYTGGAPIPTSINQAINQFTAPRPKIQPQTPQTTPASGIRGSIASMVGVMAQMLAPGVQARISARRGR